LERYAVLNRAFHARLFLPSGRPHLCRTTALLRDQVERYVRFFTSTLEKTSEDDHIQIFEAFRRGDAKLMGRLSRDHCRRVCARVIEGCAMPGKGLPPEADA
jgi:DNA-binding GntR family transcriptional regulator